MNNQAMRLHIPGLGERVRGIRNSLGLSLQAASTRGGIASHTLVQLERNDLASVRTLNGVAKALGVSVDDLTGRPSSR